MIPFNNIHKNGISFFKTNMAMLSHYQEVNSLVKKTCGLNNFFNTQQEASDFYLKIQEDNISGAKKNSAKLTLTSLEGGLSRNFPLPSISENTPRLLSTQIKEGSSNTIKPDRRAYGDFQTHEILATKVVQYAFAKQQNIDFVLEPTCGKGNFIIAALENFKALKKVVGVEIYKPYAWESKLKILSHFLHNNKNTKPDIDIFHANVFEFPYEVLADSTRDLKTVIIENPPWVTNAELGGIASSNLPKKSNFKKHHGFDAITGKGNFDIGESITSTLLNCFQQHDGTMALLLKNTVIKNIIRDQKENRYRIAGSEKLHIDARREFKATVNYGTLFYKKITLHRTGAPYRT